MKHIKVQDEPVVSTPLPAADVPGPNCGCILEALDQSFYYDSPVSGSWPLVNWDVVGSVGGSFVPGSMSGEIVVPEYGTYLWTMKIFWKTMPSLAAGTIEGTMVQGHSYGGWYYEVSSDGWWADDIQSLCMDPYSNAGSSVPSRTNEHSRSGIVMTSSTTKSIYLTGGPDFNTYNANYVHPLGLSEWDMHATLTLVSSLTGDFNEELAT